MYTYSSFDLDTNSQYIPLFCGSCMKYVGFLICFFFLYLGTKLAADGYAGTGRGPDEIIELQDIRLSPIPSIRNRHSRLVHFF